MNSPGLIYKASKCTVELIFMGCCRKRESFISSMLSQHLSSSFVAIVAVCVVGERADQGGGVKTSTAQISCGKHGNVS